MCLLIWTVFSGERCGPWASCYIYLDKSCRNPWHAMDLQIPLHVRVVPLALPIDWTPWVSIYRCIPMIPITVSSKGIRSDGDGPPLVRFNSFRCFAAFFFVNDMYVAHFFEFLPHFSQVQWNSRNSLWHIWYPRHVFGTVCCRGWKFGKKNTLIFSTSFSRVWISISEKLGFRFLVTDAMTRSKYCRYRYVD